MAGGILGIGINSLMAYKSAIATTAQNLANATTPFFSRRKVDFVEGLFNTGVQVADVRRIFDDVANRDYIQSTSQAGRYSTIFSGNSDFEAVLDDSATNINKYLNDSLKAVQELTMSVGNIGSRSALMTKLSDLANRMNAMSADVSNRREILKSNVNASVEAVNALIDQIGDINSQISYVPSGQNADLLDQRNKLVHDLAGYINVVPLEGENNSLTLTLSNGLSIVSGAYVNHFAIIPDGQDSSIQKLGLDNGQGTFSDITSFITDGSLGGLLTLRQDSYDVADRGLGRLALAISAIFNAQNKLGSDLNGNLGGNMFNDMNSSTLASGRISEDIDNTGSGTFNATIDDVSKLVVSDYQLRFTSATAYTITRGTDGTVVSSGSIASYPASATFDGVTVNITAGTFSAGDLFLVRPYAGAASSLKFNITDPLQLAMAFPVATQPGASNLGTGVIKVDEITDTSTSAFTTAAKELSPPIRVEFLTETTYQLVNATTSAVIEGPLTYDPVGGENLFPSAGGYDPGYRVSISGVVKPGDTFNIDYNQNTIGDNHNALEFSRLYTKTHLDSGTTTLNDAYNAVSSRVSLATNTSKSQRDAADSLVNQSMKRFYAVSGVDSTEEMTNLMNYQQSYQASAQIIQSAKSIFDIIFNMVR